NGFKESRAEFGDVFSSSISDSSSTSAGKGVRVNKIAQQFSQGTVDFTSRNLDLAVNGDGFFVLASADGSTEYTRAGAYSADRDGFVVNHAGQKLQVYPPVTDAAGNVTFDPGVNTTDLSLPLANSAPSATELVGTAINLDAAAEGPAVPFDPANPISYNYSTSTTIFDSLGADHTATFYYDKYESIKVTGNLAIGDDVTFLDHTDVTVLDETGTSVPADLSFTHDAVGGGGPGTWTVGLTIDGNAGTSGAAVIDFGTTAATTISAIPSKLSFSVAGTTYTVDVSALNQLAAGTSTANINNDPDFAGADNTWDVFTYIDGVDQTVTGANTLHFDTTGSILTPTSGSVLTTGTFRPSGAEAIELTVDVSDATQFGGEFSVSNLTQDGYATGRLSGLDIDATGIAFARYTNGQATAIGQIALAKFNSNQNLGKLGDTNFGETFGSGIVQLGSAGTSNFGTIQSGALEASNVDLAEQLVNLIVSQRSFQANSKVITSVDQILQTIINI
ncbi:MAG: flagellar hook protein FlgE, partial [Nitrosomonadaceae bacterium]